MESCGLADLVTTCAPAPPHRTAPPAPAPPHRRMPHRRTAPPHRAAAPRLAAARRHRRKAPRHCPTAVAALRSRRLNAPPSLCVSPGFGGRNRKCAEAFAKGEGTWDEIEERLLNGQKLQGTITSKDVSTVLKTKKMEAEFPLFTRIFEIAFEGKPVSSIIEL